MLGKLPGAGEERKMVTIEGYDPCAGSRRVHGLLQRRINHCIAQALDIDPWHTTETSRGKAPGRLHRARRLRLQQEPRQGDVLVRALGVKACLSHAMRRERICRCS